MGRPSIFFDPENEERLKNFYVQGLSSVAVGKMFGVDHTTILYQWTRLKLATTKKYEDYQMTLKGQRRVAIFNRLPKEKKIRNYPRPSFPKPKLYKDYAREAGYGVMNNSEWGITFRKLGRDLITQKLNENSNI